MFSIPHALMVLHTAWFLNPSALDSTFVGVVSATAAFVLASLTFRLVKVPSRKMLEEQIEKTERAVKGMESTALKLRHKTEETILLKEHDRKQQLLIDELNHRVKNTLAAVQSIAKQTLRTADSKEAFAETFESRLMALSQTHNLLVEHQWGYASFGDIVTRLLAPYGKYYNMQGPNVDLAPSLAVSIGMALHELATNAAKYGAWSLLDGQVDVTITTTEDNVCIEWTESGGPEIAEMPTRSSFGTRLLTRGLPGEFGGIAKLEYRRTGLYYQLCFPTAKKLADESKAIYAPRLAAE